MIPWNMGSILAPGLSGRTTILPGLAANADAVRPAAKIANTRDNDSFLKMVAAMDFI